MRYFLTFLSSVLVFLPTHVWSLDLPARGLVNGFLQQTNILECENTEDDALTVRVSLKNTQGVSLVETMLTFSAFGVRHLVLNDLAPISDSIGTLELSDATANASSLPLSCRVAFYRFAPASRGKQFEFAYVLPLRTPLQGVTGGIYNSFDPERSDALTYNWLSVVNMDALPASLTLSLFDSLGAPLSSRRIEALSPGARVDIALGHPEGTTVGVYLLTPDNVSQDYDAILMRYNPASNGGFNFAFPLRASSGTGASQTLSLSTMNNGRTQNWVEVANLGNDSQQVDFLVRNTSGALLKEEQRSVPPKAQTHFYGNSVIDVQGSGALGSIEVRTDDSNALLLAQSSYYGKSIGASESEWAYSVQASSVSASSNEQLLLPANTHLGMFNWFKATNEQTSSNALEVTVVRSSGETLSAFSENIAAGGSLDSGIHGVAGANFLGSLFASPTGSQTRVAAHLLRVLPRTDGQLGYIVHVPANVQNKASLPPVSDTGYFPRSSVWYQDISQAALDSQSAAVISWLESAGGWGSGEMRIDFSIEVLEADAGTPLQTFTPTEDFYSPDCDQVSLPVPANGALEGENGYQCTGDGDCHLIVVERTSKTLYEMWRANIVGNSFFGGCLAVWDLNRNYPATGRGQDCTSADASGFPIAPLLFTAEEVQAGEIDHAIRFILPNARIRHRTYVHPATHATGAASGPATAPPYGARLRLRADFPLASLPNEGARVVARAMQKYGILLSDGGTIALTAQSDRFSNAKWSGLLGTRDLRSIRVSDFQMVEGGERFTFSGDCVRNP